MQPVLTTPLQHCAMVWGGHAYYWADYTCSEDTSAGGHVIHALCEAGPGPRVDHRSYLVRTLRRAE